MAWLLRGGLSVLACALLWVGGRGLATLRATPASLLADLPTEVEPGWALIEVAFGGERQECAARLAPDLAEWLAAELEGAQARDGAREAGEYRNQVGTGRRAALGARSTRLHVYLGERAAPGPEDPLLRELARRALAQVVGAGPGELGARFVGRSPDGRRRVDWAWVAPRDARLAEDLGEAAGWRDSASVY
jgi:uncharacterized SAM-binding protein YcdF (DUF218 family)